MNISLNWLNSLLDTPVTAEEAERVLTDLGLPLDGTDAAGSDVVLDVEVTSNRSDCLSHVGVAREVAAATGAKLLAPAFELPPAGSDQVESITSVENQDLDGCPHYTARMIRGVRVAPSPDWLVERIESIGLRPVNNVVDITNFVLHELGQPLHAFDFAQLAGGKVVVRRSAAAEGFVAIDGSRHELPQGLMVIADDRRPVAIAGVMGGEGSEVTEQTTDILLESARFDPIAVRTASRRLKLASDSSYRFERGVDPLGVERASCRAAQLIVEIAGGTLAHGMISVGDVPDQPVQTALRPARCNELLGTDLSQDDITQLLDALGLDPRAEGDVIRCTIPSFRLDLRREADLIEEVARLYGYDRIGREEKVTLEVRPPQVQVQARQALGQVLTAHGFFEAITFSFLPRDQARAFAGGDDLVEVNEEKKKSEPALQPSLLPGLLNCRKANQDAGNPNVRLYEVARCFRRRGGAFHESRNLALLADALEPGQAMREMRGTIEELLGRLGLADRVRIDPADPSPNWSADAAEIRLEDRSEALGAYGPASADITGQFDLQSQVILAELDYTALVSSFPPQPIVSVLARFPAIERDLSVVVDEATPWAAVEAVVADIAPDLMERIDFVTVYRGKQVGVGRKSVTLRLTFRDPTRTLHHDEVSAQVESVVAGLSGKLRAELRAG